jgi:predicted TIM-barrel fold metal-dependent hydrolase
MNAYPYDERMAVVWREADRRGLTVTAMCAGPGPEAYSHPANFEAVARDYPKCKVVLAHMGLGGGEEVVAKLTATYPNVFGDTSSWLGRVGQPGERTAAETVDLFRRIGTDRIIYGSNYPLSDASQYVEILTSLPLTERERHQVFHENAERVYPGIGAQEHVSVVRSDGDGTG